MKERKGSTERPCANCINCTDSGSDKAVPALPILCVCSCHRAEPTVVLDGLFVPAGIWATCAQCGAPMQATHTITTYYDVSGGGRLVASMVRAPESWLWYCENDHLPAEHIRGHAPRRAVRS